MGTIIHRIGIQGEIQKVYEALATVLGISDWWTKDTRGESEIGKTVVARFHTLEGNEIGSMQFEIRGLEPDKKIHWKFVEGPPEWIGTEVIFDLHQEDHYTIVMFSHIHWAEEVEFKAHCSMKWAVFMLSLKQLIENGKGQPSPHDIKIDNWN